MTDSSSGFGQKKYHTKRLLRQCFPLLLLAVIVVSLLVGCQLLNSANTTPSDLTSTASQLTETAQTTASTAVTLAPTVAPTTSHTLVIWLPPQFDPQSTSETGKLVHDRLDAFTKAYPKWTVEVRLKAVEGRGGLLDSLANTSMAAPDALPAVIALQYQDLESAALKGLLLPLTNRVPAANDQNWLPYAAQMGKIQGETFGVPLAGDALALIYHPNQTPFPPGTWQELSTQKIPVIFPAADPYALVIAAIYQTAGGDLFVPGGSPVLEAVPLQKSFGLLDNGIQSGAFPPWIAQISTFNAAWDTYRQLSSGYAIVWSSQYLQEKLSTSEITNLPAINSKQFTLAQGWVWCVPEIASQSQEAALQLMEFLSAADFIDAVDNSSGYLPVYKSGLDKITDPQLQQTIRDITASATILPPSSTMNLLEPILEDSTVQIITKETDYQQAIQKVLDHFK
jgi:maltose-binding protein MalE